MLAQALIYNISGHAARSELDKLSEPLKKLVVRQINAKSWFGAALLDANFPSDKVSDKDKQIFLQKIMKYEKSAPNPNPNEFTDLSAVFAEPEERTR